MSLKEISIRSDNDSSNYTDDDDDDNTTNDDNDNLNSFGPEMNSSLLDNMTKRPGTGSNTNVRYILLSCNIMLYLIGLILSVIELKYNSSIFSFIH